MLNLALVSLATSVYTWRLRRELAAARLLAVGLGLSTVILLTYLLVGLTHDQDLAFQIVRVRYACLAFLIPLYMQFVLEYNESTFGRGWRWLLYVIPAITLILVAREPRLGGGLVFGRWHLVYLHDLPVEQRQFATWGWVHFVYTHTLLILVLVLLGRQLRRANSLYHNQSTWLIGGMSLAMAVAFVAALPLTMLQRLPNLTPVAIGVAQLTFAWAIFREHMLNALPVAYTVLWENMNDAALVLDKNQVVLGVNPSAEKLFGLNRRAIVGKPCDDLDGLSCSLLSGQTILTIGDRVLDVSLSPLTVRERRSYGYLVTLRDITAHKLAEQHAVELAIERERSRLLVGFVHSAGHEFRTPLSVIQSSLYLLERIDDPASQAKNRRRIQEQADRIMSLVESLIQIVRLDQLRQLDLKPTNVNSLIEVVAERWRVPMAEKGVELQLDLTPTLVLPLADDEFVIALHHLIDNALRHTPPHGRVVIHTVRQPSRVCIEVADTGEGIEPQVLPHIFQRLYRADEARTLPGFGLGLSIVQRIVDLHHGVIEAESAVGQGSCFRILLPLDGLQRLSASMTGQNQE